MENKRCVICGGVITQRKEKAKTCNQSCAGKLAWRTMLFKGDKNE